MARMRLLLTLAITAALAGNLLIVPPAGATRPSKEAFSFRDVINFRSGTICDFAYHREFTITGTFFTFFRQDGEVVRGMEIRTAKVLHRNVATGYILTETVRAVTTFYVRTLRAKVVGLNWHLRDAQGKIVAVHAGQIVFDLEQGEPGVLVKATPNFAPEFSEVLCPALGGSPA